MRFIPLIILFAGLSFLLSQKAQVIYEKERESKEPEITILFAGDIILDRGIEYYVNQNGGDWTMPFQKINKTLKEADILFANLESIISDKGEKVGSIYSFRSKPESMEALTSAGFDVVSVANNHSFDYGREALADSMQRLQEAGIGYTGGGKNYQEAHTPYVIEKEGIHVGFLGYTTKGLSLWQAAENSPGIAFVDESRISELKEDILNAKPSADILVVSFHFGEEYQKEPSEEQILLSRAAIDAGASIVIGHHPHVVQKIEEYKEGFIAYSLGNFLFDQYFSKETMEGMLLKVTANKKGITAVTPIKVEMNYLYQPAI